MPHIHGRRTNAENYNQIMLTNERTDDEQALKTKELGVQSTELNFSVSSV